ncbi:sensor domain-containing diguanylate cyclase [Halobacillus sp. BAB-2008]|uniref:sensor domain-containing diguanylate cyclase n=1 Tax=Halobacillus sp. BAB-2008 TaxID=1246484 RepID=UPI0002A4E42D|nr:sensor domain-containing diguanylate cyclase [Halobacillus sp. BAB-2008]ELK48430.1 hypothetical protein D479_02372 [Halobacillus sp. BAB-2008]
MQELLIYICLYLLPAGMMFHLALDVWGRNRRSTEHILLGSYIFLYGTLFFFEFIRNQVDISYSPFITTYLFGNAGLLLLSLSLHFIFKVTHLYKRMAAYLYPWIFYVPAVPVLLTLLLQTNLTNSAAFEHVGLFHYPEYNTEYLMTMTIGNVFHFGIVLLLVYLYKTARVPVQKRVLKTLMIVAGLVLIWDVIFGYLEIRGFLPPYPYIYGGIIWAFALNIAMKKFDFLASYSRRFSILYDLNPSSILLIDRKGRIDSANPATNKLLRYVKLTGHNLTDSLAESFKEATMSALDEAFETGGKFSGLESKIVTADGRERFVLIDGDFLLIDQRIYLMLIIRDIHMMKEARSTAEFLAYHDPLTKLPNRRRFYEKAEGALAGKENMALLVFDLDGFKTINDTYGHQVGDGFLVHIADSLTEFIPPDGFAARVGGDEFYGMIHYENREELESRVTFLTKEIRQRVFHYGTIDIPVRFSLGISCFPEHGDELEVLIAKADEAMYVVKQERRNGHSFWSSRTGVTSPSK